MTLPKHFWELFAMAIDPPPGDDPDPDTLAQWQEDVRREAERAGRRERAWHRASTERLKIYATLLRVTLPRIGAASRVEAGTIEIDPDVAVARHLAIEAIFADIRRIAGGGRPLEGSR